MLTRAGEPGARRQAQMQESQVHTPVSQDCVHAAVSPHVVSQVPAPHSMSHETAAVQSD